LDAALLLPDEPALLLDELPQPVITAPAMTSMASANTIRDFLISALPRLWFSSPLARITMRLASITAAGQPSHRFASVRARDSL
jgi:hypothetical protein